jgi:DNA anti-recombination protein RmuC
MAQKRGNGSANGDTQSAMLDVLKAIHESTEQTRVELRGELQGVRGEVRQEKEEVRLLKDETHAGFAEVGGELHEVRDRLGNIRDLAGEWYRALEERVSRLEARSGT